ncbi:hypothetical protein HDU76_005279 [Blyttiomyces sp. JEL0837]|nr:hypothetical protein HDU76_005279 [Blyttiomyces sp. JEL0837]
MIDNQTRLDDEQQQQQQQQTDQQPPSSSTTSPSTTPPMTMIAPGQIDPLSLTGSSGTATKTMTTQILQVNPLSFPFPSTITTTTTPTTSDSDTSSPPPFNFNQLHSNPPTKTYIQDLTSLRTAAKILQTTNQPIAFPTETVYGLGANALNPSSVSSIFAAKGRPSDNPLIVHISNLEMLKTLLPPNTEIPSIYLPLLHKLWPGPLTILLPKGPQVPATVTAGHASVAVRMPQHPIALALISTCGFPIAAPSANTSGRPSPTRAQHVYDDLNGRIPLIIDDGIGCFGGVESTVLDGLSVPPVILRPGGVTVETIRGFKGFENVRVFKKDFVDAAMEAAPVTPGMKYKHYSPSVEVVLFEIGESGASGSDHSMMMMNAIAKEGLNMIKNAKTSPTNTPVIKVGLLRTTRTPIPSELAPHAIEHFLGDATDPASVARELFNGLRSLESEGVVGILVEGIGEAREGLAVMNRLRKAAGRVVTV